LYRIIRFFFFFFPPERAHYLAADLLHFSLKIPGLKKLLHHLFVVNDVNLETKVFDVTFKNPVGLAAGFDKNASYYNDFSHLGFGFIEIGTVTPIAQDGNPKPRLFRLKSDDAIINRMGFNNGGVEEVLKNLNNRNTDIVIGGNIGKNKVTSNEDAVLDYIICFNSLYPYVDYFVVNVSSPNTPNLRELQEKEPLTKLLLSLQQENASKEKPKPILLKIAPDLTNQQLDDVIEVVETCKLSGIVATNTTINRSGLSTTNDELQKIGAGGLSGKPLKSRSTEVINYIHTKSEGRFPIIGVGGIHSAEDALEKLDAGASLVQLYTGFIYEGPSLVKKINQAISKRNG
jgi:dihydroorotate dehydrogenase